MANGEDLMGEGPRGVEEEEIHQCSGGGGVGRWRHEGSRAP